MTETSAYDLGGLDSCAEEPPSIAETEEIIARELSSLSVQEREDVFSDVHGVSGEIEETPELLKTNLEKLKFETAALREKDALDLALNDNPSYVLDESFLLRFLRADRFDPKKAAARLALHFEFKLELFGRDKLCRDICQDDLSKKDIEVLYSGLSQLLPLRDMAGRLVFVWQQSEQHRNMDAMSKLRRMFYVGMAFHEDIETQRKGTVAIIYCIGGGTGGMSSKSNNRFIQKCTKLKTALPFFEKSLHYCYHSPLFIPWMALVQFSSPWVMRLRFQAHYGDEEECLAKLRSYGIPTCVFPINEKGKTSRENYIRMLEKRRAHERLSKKSDRRVGVPSRNDVLFGRGTVVQYHVGNIRYLSYVDDRKPGYANASKQKKKEMTEEVVAIIKNNGGRFLKDDGTGWVEVDDEVARLKVSHAFRRR